MRPWILALGPLFSFPSAAPAQSFGFTHRMLPAETDFTAAVALGDLDGDGDLDAYVGNTAYPPGGPAPESRLYLNGGTGEFADAMNLPVPQGFTQSVALGDVDGDGDLDAYVGREGQDRLQLNGGGGTLTDVTGTNLPALTDDTQAVALGDVDGDGDLDAFLGNNGLNRLLLNGGTGVFTDVTALPVLLDNTRAVALGDVDGDGDLDALVGNFPAFGGPTDRLYLNGGTGVFTDASATNFPVFPSSLTRAVALGDVDGDGDLDAIKAGFETRLFLNGGTGVFSGGFVLAYNPYTNAVALGDVDGDGDLDLYVGTGEQDRLLLNGGTGVFADATATNLPVLSDDTQTVAPGDVDGDGDLDSFVGNFSQDHLLLNGGTGAFVDVTEAEPVPALPDPVRAVALGDVDGDGDLDAFLGNYGLSRLLLNGGAGTFTDVSATSVPGLLADTNAVALGDVDGDGDLDAFLGITGSNRLFFNLLNLGAAVFIDVTPACLPVLGAVTKAVALGDVDGDGDLDAFAGIQGPNIFAAGGQDRLYLNTGAGVFTDATATNLPALLDHTAAVALGDVDGDGDLDAFLGNEVYSLGAQDRLYLNGGAGVFTDVTATNLPAQLDVTRAVALGDVDGDGDLDALAGNGGYLAPGQSRLYFNDGAGAFTDVTPTNWPAMVGNTTAAALGDVDEDGDLDALVGNGANNVGTPSQNRLFLNDSAGAFTDVTTAYLPALTGSASAVALGDIDRDGDLDAVVPFAGTRVYTNLSRQLSWRGVPRVGKPLVLDVRGPGGGPWVVGASLATADILLPPFGALRLHPATLFVVAGGALDPAGRASLSINVPAIPALVGFTVYYQAVVGPPFRFTNLETTTAVAL